MDYLEEQKGEIEALDSIYYGDITVLSTEPHYKFSIPIKSEEYDSDIDNNGLACDLVFTYTPKYPEESPIIEIEKMENFQEDYEAQLTDYLKQQVQENLGMVMIFTLVSSAQEWLNVRWEEVKKQQEEETAKKLKAEEEAELKRFEGTRVTVETFLKWRTVFEEETGIARKREIIEKEGKKLTGRELFMTDKTLNESDLKFLEDGDAVKVDESLFQDLDDLEIDDEDDDDFDPNHFGDSDSETDTESQ